MSDVKQKILLVDDNPNDLDVYRRYLQEDPNSSYEVAEVEMGEEAIEFCQQQLPDCMLLDYRLPDLDGLEVLEQLETAKLHVPVIMLTGQGDEKVAHQAIQAGAQDYLVKGEIDSKTLSRAIRYARERFRRISAERELRETQVEMSAASKIQQRLFPAGPPQISGFDIAGDCQPTSSTGGDYYDYIPMADGKLGIVVADVSSHGFAPALIMAGTRRLLRTLASVHNDVGQIATLANDAICEDTDPGQFVTLFFLALDPSNASFVYAGAGHESWIVQTDATARHLDSLDMPLGVLQAQSFEVSDLMTLSPGEIAVLLTDGFQEAERPDGTQFEIDRVLGIIAKHRDEPAKALLKRLFAEVRAFCAPEVPKDDLTAIIIKTE